MPTDPGLWSPDRWFLTAVERDNDATALDLRAARRIAWTTGTPAASACSTCGCAPPARTAAVYRREPQDVGEPARHRWTGS